MKLSKSLIAALGAVSLLFLLTGCGPKASGTWTLPDQGNGAGSLILNKDGTGTMNMPPSPGGQIKWTEDGSALKIFMSTDDPKTATPLMTGTLSSDNKQDFTLGIGAEGMSVTQTLTRQ